MNGDAGGSGLLFLAVLMFLAGIGVGFLLFVTMLWLQGLGMPG